MHQLKPSWLPQRSCDMPDGSAPQADAQNLLAIPALVLGMWGPWLIGAARLGAHSQQGFGTLASEWQNFLGRRVKEDFTFVQRITQGRTPDEIWAAQCATKDASEEMLPPLKAA